MICRQSLQLSVWRDTCFAAASASDPSTYLSTMVSLRQTARLENELLSGTPPYMLRRPLIPTGRNVKSPRRFVGIYLFPWILSVTLLTCTYNAAAGSGGEDTNGPRREAKRLRDQGVAEVDRGELGRALEDFQRAYLLYPSPNLLFNIGIVFDRLGSAADAVAAFEQFIAKAPNAPGDAREFAIARLSELRPQVAWLDIVVTPADATVLVDEHPASARDLPLMPGEHVITATRAGHRAACERVTLVAGERRRVELLAEALPAIPPPATLVAPRPVAEDAARLRMGRRARVSGIAVGSVGIAALAAGAGLASLTASLERSINHPPDGAMFDAAAVGRANTAQSLEIAFFTIGSAAVATAVALLVAASRTPRRTASPLPSRSVAALALIF
jgi:hypothetical protein